MSLKNEDDSTTSVSNIEPYQSMPLKNALKRKNVIEVDIKTFDNIKNMTEEDIVNTYKIKMPLLISSGKKHLLVSES